MKSLRQLSAFSWLVVLGWGIAFAPASLGQSGNPKATEPSKPEPPCPRLNVSCPSQLKEGQGLTFVVTVIGADAGAALTYDWTVYGGTIIQGQGTPFITLNSEGRRPRSVTATVTVGGLNSTCATTASCSLIPGPPPPSTKFDSYEVLPRKQEKERLDGFAAMLKSQPGTMGYILSYGARRGSASAARAAGKRAKAYLLSERNIDTGRIFNVEGGSKERLTIELWIVPTGAISPKPNPTVDRGALKP